MRYLDDRTEVVPASYSEYSSFVIANSIWWACYCIRRFLWRSPSRSWILCTGLLCSDGVTAEDVCEDYGEFMAFDILFTSPKNSHTPQVYGHAPYNRQVNILRAKAQRPTLAELAIKIAREVDRFLVSGARASHFIV